MRELLGALARNVGVSPIAGLTWRRGWQGGAQRRTRIHARRIAPSLDYGLLPDPRGYLVKTFLGATYCRTPGRARLSLSLHVLRRGRDVSRRHRAAARGATRC